MVTDVAIECVMKFSLTGKFLTKLAQDENKARQFIGMAGLRC